MAKFCSLFSGSSGNCTFIESGGTGVLIDAGVSAKAIGKALEDIGSGFEKIAAVFVTHEHSDHIKGLPLLANRLKIPIFANAGTIEGILHECKTICESSLFELPTGASVDIANMNICSFETSHDSRESVGYRIHTSDGRRIAVATDLGFISDTVLFGITHCELIMIESNHDIDMLKNGSYPYFLKQRILSQRGHLSNDDCAATLIKLMEGGTKHFVLAHLSKDNNLPELALSTAMGVLHSSGLQQGSDYTIEAAPRFGPGKLYSF